MAETKTKYNIHQKICQYENCNKEYWAQKRDSKFCSKSCAVSWRNSNDPKWKANIVEGMKNSEKVKAVILSMHTPEINRIRSEKTKKMWEDRRDEMIEGQKQAYKDDPSIVAKRHAKISLNKDRGNRISAALKEAHAKDPYLRFRMTSSALNKYNSSDEQKFEDYCKHNSIKFKRQFFLDKKSFDFYLEDTNTLVEIDGTFFHPERIPPTGLKRIQILNLFNDFEKNRIAKEHNFQLLRIRKKDVENHRSLDEICYFNVNKHDNQKIEWNGVSPIVNKQSLAALDTANQILIIGLAIKLKKYLWNQLDLLH